MGVMEKNKKFLLKHRGHKSPLSVLVMAKIVRKIDMMI